MKQSKDTKPKKSAGFKKGDKVEFTGKDSWGIQNDHGWYTYLGKCSETDAVCKFDGGWSTEFVILPLRKLKMRELRK